MSCDLVKIMQQEIDWCNKHLPKEFQSHYNFKKGFIQGLKQAKRIIQEEKRCLTKLK